MCLLSASVHGQWWDRGGALIQAAGPGCAQIHPECWCVDICPFTLNYSVTLQMSYCDGCKCCLCVCNWDALGLAFVFNLLLQRFTDMMWIWKLMVHGSWSLAGGHDNVSARKFLDAARHTGDQMLFYTVFRSFQQRNQRLRGSPGFNPGNNNTHTLFTVPLTLEMTSELHLSNYVLFSIIIHFLFYFHYKTSFLIFRKLSIVIFWWQKNSFTYCLNPPVDTYNWVSTCYIYYVFTEDVIIEH